MEYEIYRECDSYPESVDYFMAANGIWNRAPDAGPFGSVIRIVLQFEDAPTPNQIRNIARVVLEGNRVVFHFDAPEEMTTPLDYDP